MKNFIKTILLTLIAFIALGVSLSEARFEGAVNPEPAKVSIVKKKSRNFTVQKINNGNHESPAAYESNGCTDAEAHAYDLCMEQTCSSAPNDSESMECDDYCVEESGCDGGVEFEE